MKGRGGVDVRYLRSGLGRLRGKSLRGIIGLGGLKGGRKGKEKDE